MTPRKDATVSAKILANWRTPNTRHALPPQLRPCGKDRLHPTLILELLKISEATRGRVDEVHEQVLQIVRNRMRRSELIKEAVVTREDIKAAQALLQEDVRQRGNVGAKRETTITKHSVKSQNKGKEKGKLHAKMKNKNTSPRSSTQPSRHSTRLKSAIASQERIELSDSISDSDGQSSTTITATTSTQTRTQAKLRKRSCPEPATKRGTKRAKILEPILVESEDDESSLPTPTHSREIPETPPQSPTPTPESTIYNPKHFLLSPASEEPMMQAGSDDKLGGDSLGFVEPTISNNASPIHGSPVRLRESTMLRRAVSEMVYKEPCLERKRIQARIHELRAEENEHQRLAEEYQAKASRHRREALVLQLEIEDYGKKQQDKSDDNNDTLGEEH